MKLSSEEAPQSVVSFKEFLSVWIRVAALSFGGPAGQIGVMHRIVVDEKKWISESRFLHALNYCMLLPGPEAQQLATYLGWMMRGKAGGLVAGGLFILPGFVSILILSIVYSLYKQLDWVDALFFGLKAAVLAIVIHSLVKIGQKALRSRFAYILAASAFVCLFFLKIPFPWVVLSAAFLGLVLGKLKPHWLDQRAHGSEEGSRLASRAAKPLHWLSSVRTLVVGLLVWLAPIVLLGVWLGSDHAIFHGGVFFSKAATVTFGGAYSVLAYVGQQAVEVYAWLEPGEMLDGLGMAETTPGPLIQVVQFVGFMGGYRGSGELSPLAGGVLGSIVTTWATFAPCFVWIFLGAPYIERLLGNKSAGYALSSITAAVVGVILNLAIWFGVHVVFGVVSESSWGALHWPYPELSSVNWVALFITVGSFIALFMFKWNMLKVLGVAVAVGSVAHFVDNSLS